MTDERAFLQEITTSPEEDLPRLVFADWLEEQGDPRARFIRIQCEAARLPRFDAHRLTLEDQAFQLQPAQEELWLQDREKHVQEVFFQRGFIQKVKMTASRFLRHGEELFEELQVPDLALSRGDGRIPEFATSITLRHVKSLEILEKTELENHLMAGDIAMIALSPHLENLERLHLRVYGIGEDGAKGFRDATALHRLRELKLDLSVRGGRHPIFLQHLTTSNSLPQLESLRIQSGSFRRSELRSLIYWKQFPQLKRLEFVNCDLSPNDLAILSDTDSFPGLHTLDLSGNHISFNTCELLARIRRLDGLEVLRLNNTFPGNLGVEVIATGVFRPRELQLAHNHLGDEALIALVEAGLLERTENLNLASNNLTGTSIRVLANSPSISRLQSLDLSRNRLDAQAIRELVHSPHLRELRKLNLEENSLGNRGAKAIARASQLPKLAVLNLTRTEMGNSGWSSLSGTTRLPQLRELHLEWNALDLRSIKDLAHSRLLANLLHCHFGIQKPDYL